MSKANPVSPKAHGAWLGAGTGALLGQLVAGLLSHYLNHDKSLPTVDVTAITSVCTAVVAFVGAWLAPLLPKSGA